MMLEPDYASSTMHLAKADEPETASTTPTRRFSRSVPAANVNSAGSPTGLPQLLARRRAQSTPPELTNDKLLRNGFLARVKGLSTAADMEAKWNRTNLSKKRSQYFEKEFAYREPPVTARERVVRNSMIMIDIKLNYCLDENEQPFQVDLSFALSEIYQRSASCIMITVCTNVSIFLSGTSEPAYYLTVTALPSEIAATKNKRSAHIIQHFIRENLNIPVSRGVVRFVAVAEENLASNGLTALQEIEELERVSTDGGTSRTAGHRKSRRNRKSNTTSSDDHRNISTSVRPFNPPFLRQLEGGNSEELAEDDGTHTAPHRSVTKRKSFMSFLGL